MMEYSCSRKQATALFLLFAAIATGIGGALAQSSVTCSAPYSPCFRKKIRCPGECPYTQPSSPHARACFLNCYNPKCEAVCQHRIPNCNGHGSGCYDPRFIGGDGVVFYFHGRRNEYFSLVSDPNLQINARFIGHRPAGRPRDFTWIQALGIMSGSHNFTVEATRAARWEDSVDHLQFSIDGEALEIPEGHRSEWRSADNASIVERTGSRNSVMVTLEGVAEIMINVVPITKEDSRIHSYHIPSDDCYAHLEVQFRFYRLSAQVEGVIGRTYRPDFENPAKRGVAMAVVGGEDKYRTSSLLSSDCKLCHFDPVVQETEQVFPVADN